jgi:hypothetical protein
MMKGDETADGASLVETDPSQPNQQEPTAIKSPTINKNTLSFRAPSRNAPENTVGSPSQPMPYTMAIPASGFYPYAPAYSPMSPSPIDIYGQPYHAMASNGTPGGWYNYSPLPVYHLPNGMVSPAIGPHAGMVYLHPAYAEQLIGVPPSQSMPSTAVNATRNYPINNDENIDYCSNDDGDELGAGNEADDEAESMEPQQSPVYDNTGRFNGAGNGNFTSSNGDGSVGYAKAHGARIRDKNNHMSRRNLYIRNLPKSMTDAILFELSSRYKLIADFLCTIGISFAGLVELFPPKQ